MLDISGLNRGRSAISKLIHIELMGEKIDEPIFLRNLYLSKDESFPARGKLL